MLFAAADLVSVSAFTDNGQGGNPAGVWTGTQFPAQHEMQRIAAEAGFSETAFAIPVQGEPAGV